MNVGDTLRKRVGEIDKELASKDGDINLLKAQIKDLKHERQELIRILNQLDRPSRNGNTTVSDEQILEAVKARGKNVDSGAVAEHLGVTKRNVARKLRKLVDDGHLSGNPEKGYSLKATSKA